MKSEKIFQFINSNDEKEMKKGVDERNLKKTKRTMIDLISDLVKMK